MLPLLALSESDQPMLVWWIIGAAIALGPALHSWIKVYEFAKGKSVDAAQFVTKAELAVMREERDQQISNSVQAIRGDITNLVKVVDSLKDDQKDLRQTLNEDIKAMNRALGTVEGELNPAPRRRRA